MLSVQCMAGFGNFRPEVNWQFIDFEPLYTVSYGTFFSGFPPKNIRICVPRTLLGLSILVVLTANWTEYCPESCI